MSPLRATSSALVVLALSTVPLVACSTSDDVGSRDVQSSSSSKAAEACSKKVCGADCTPAGSDEPFNCDAVGKCVAAGQPLGCEPNAPDACAGKACGVDCTPAGSDEPFNCDAVGKCVATGQPLRCEAGTVDPCAGKACGSNCTPAGSDEPFVCDALGKCVAAAQPHNCEE
jgi:hypothetical protein